MVLKCVIIGASHTAAQLVTSLRQSGWQGDITVIGDEDSFPYHRPPLSKDFLSGDKTIDDILIRPAEAYVSADVQFKLQCRVSKIDRKQQRVLTESGEKIPYDKLVICTGARVRKLPITGADLPNVFYLRDKNDVLSIQGAITKSRKAIVIGGGYIGLETAASLRKLGLEVIVLEAMSRLLERVTADKVSEFFKRVHTEEGVNVQTDAKVSKIVEVEKGLQVFLDNGESIVADIVIVGIGVIPNVELAEDCGLEVINGISVNQFCLTNDPNIYAAGDVSWHYCKTYDRHVRLESVPNATEQAKIIASHLCGFPKAYDSLPWFWSDQFDMKLQIAGLSTGYSEIIIRGDIHTGRSFAAFYFNGDDFLAVDAVNAPREFAFSRMVLSKGKSLNKEMVGNIDLALKDMIMAYH